MRKGRRKIYKSLILITIVFLCLSIFQYNSFVYVSSEPTTVKEFRFVSVNLFVEDINGTPIQGAEVLAFSEEWGIRSPGTLDQKTFWSTDSSGKVSMIIPVGRWSFFAVSGSSYAYAHRGRGFFLASVNLTINANLSITLRPSTTITIYPKDCSGNSIDVEARVMESNHTPIVPTDVAAVSSGGVLSIDVSGGYSYDLLLVKKPDSFSDGYYITLKKIPGGFNNQISFQKSELACITFKAYDASNKLTDGNVEVRLPEFDLNNMVVDFSFHEKATVYFTPSVVQFNYRFIKSGWYLYLVGNNFFNLTAGDSQTICFGGPFNEELQVIPWASTGAGGSPVFAPKTQVWLKITDSFGHILYFMGTPSGRPQFPFTLIQNGATIFSSFIPQGDPFTLFINAEYQRDSSPKFTVSGDLGPFGLFQLNGTLISDATMYKIVNITTQYFLVAVPEGFPNTTSRHLDFIDKLYETYADMVGAPIDGQVQYEVDIMGGGFWWEHLPVPAKVLLCIYITSDPLNPSTLYFSAHEFGHTRTLRSPTLIAPDYFGESIPTLLAIEGISRLYGHKMWLWGTGSHDLFFYHLRGTPLRGRGDLIETSQFVLAYIEKTYGWRAHKSIINGWSGNLASLVKKLTQNGFNQVETLATLYSFVVGDNLGWLFDIAGLGVTEARVKQGLSLIAPGGPHANFNWAPLKPIAGKPITLDASYSLPGWNGTSTMPIVQYIWDFGDGTNATGPNVIHTYTSPGNYTITLKVKDSQGLWNIKQKQIEVSGQRSIALQVVAAPFVAGVRSPILIYVNSTPPLKNRFLTISYFTNKTMTWNTIGTFKTSSEGVVVCVFIPSETGEYKFKADWAGDSTSKPTSAESFRVLVFTKSMTVEDIVNLMNQLNEKEKELKNYRDTISKLQKDIDDLQSKISSLELQLAETQSKLTEATSRAQLTSILSLIVGALVGVIIGYLVFRRRP